MQRPERRIFHRDKRASERQWRTARYTLKNLGWKLREQSCVSRCNYYQIRIKNNEYWTLVLYDNSYQYNLVNNMPSSYNLADLDKKRIDALVKSGFYSSKSDVVKDALRYMFEHKKNLNLAAAVEMYKHERFRLEKLLKLQVSALLNSRKYFQAMVTNE